MRPDGRRPDLEPAASLAPGVAPAAAPTWAEAPPAPAAAPSIVLPAAVPTGSPATPPMALAPSPLPTSAPTAVPAAAPTPSMPPPALAQPLRQFSTARTTRRAAPREARAELQRGSPLLSQSAGLRELEAQDPTIVGRKVLCTLLPNFDEEAYRMLLSVQLFEAEATIFVSCTKDVGHLLPKLFPNLRFIIFPWLYLAAPLKTTGHTTPPTLRKFGLWADYDTEKLQILQTAFQHGASSAWYIESDVVLFQALPAFDEKTEAAASAQRGSPKKQPSSPGLLFFSSKSALTSFVQGQLSPTELGCSHSVGWYEVDPGYSLQGVDRYAEVNCDGSEVTFNGCKIASMQYREYYFARRWFKHLMPAIHTCHHPVGPVFQTADEWMALTLDKKYRWERSYPIHKRFPVDPFYLAPGPCQGSWCQPESAPKVIFERSLFDLASPAAHVQGQVVISVVIPDLLSEQVHQFLRSIETFMVTTAIFVTCTQEVARQLPIHYSTLRFVFRVVLGKYQDDKTGLVHVREELVKAGLWMSFLAEGPALARFALDNGARAVWSLDLQTTLLAELPVPDAAVKVSLNPLAGRGQAYFASIDKIDKWMRSLSNEDAREAGLEVFQTDPDVQSLECGAEVGRTWTPADADIPFVCIRGNSPGTGVVLWKECPVASLHYPSREAEIRMTPSLFNALGECQHMALPVIQRVLPPVMLQHKLIESFDPRSNVVGHIAIATTVLEVTNEVHRLLQSISAFEANTVIFVSCSIVTADKLQNNCPSLRFSFHTHLDKYKDQEKGQMTSKANMVKSGVLAAYSSQKAVLMRTAFRAGAKAVWYIPADVVLLAPLPAIEPSVEVAYAPATPLPEPATLVEDGSGLIYFSRAKLVDLWLQNLTTEAESGEPRPAAKTVLASQNFATEILRKMFPEQQHALTCGHAVDFGSSDGQGACSDVQCTGGSLQLPTCKLFSILARATSCLKPLIKSCLPTISPLLEATVPLPTIGHTPSLSRKDWVRAASPDAQGLQEVTFWNKKIRVTDPSANVVGRVVAAIVSSKIKDEVLRVLRGFQIFEADTTVFVVCLQNVADEIQGKYPNMRLSIYPHLDKYRNRATWHWEKRRGMEGLKGEVWMHLNLEKARVMKYAIAAGATGVWYGDTDTVQVAPFPLHAFSAKAGLSPHRYVESKWRSYGYMNAGYAYLASIPMCEKWINSTYNLNTDIHNRDQVGLSVLRFDPDAVENDCGVDVGTWQMRDETNLLFEPIYSLIRCVDGKVMFKDCHLSSLHYHNKLKEATRLAQYLEKAFFQCYPEGLEVITEGSAKPPLPPTPLDVVEPIQKPDGGGKIPLNSPESGIPGKVVICLVLQRHDQQMLDVVRSVTSNEGEKTLIIAASEDLAFDLPSHFQKRFAFWRQMNKFRQHPDYEWPTPDMMIKSGTWPAYRQVKFDLMRTALENGAIGVWYLSLDVVLKSKLPTLPSNKKIGLARHTQQLSHQPSAGTGLYDEGLIYVANLEALRKLEALSKTPENYDSLQDRPELEELGVGSFWHYRTHHGA